MKKIIEYLNINNKTVSTMESASGGYLASSITNISGSSLVFKFGAVTYSNEYKIKMGVDKELIANYSVYSLEVAKDMSFKISSFTNSNYGVGVTGKINAPDPNNDYGDDSTIYLSLYDKDKDKYYTKTIKAVKENRIKNKELIVDEVISLFKEFIINRDK